MTVQSVSQSAVYWQKLWSPSPLLIYKWFETSQNTRQIMGKTPTFPLFTHRGSGSLNQTLGARGLGMPLVREYRWLPRRLQSWEMISCHVAPREVPLPSSQHQSTGLFPRPREETWPPGKRMRGPPAYSSLQSPLSHPPTFGRQAEESIVW